MYDLVDVDDDDDDAMMMMMMKMKTVMMVMMITIAIIKGTMTAEMMFSRIIWNIYKQIYKYLCYVLCKRNFFPNGFHTFSYQWLMTILQ